MAAAGVRFLRRRARSRSLATAILAAGALLLSVPLAGSAAAQPPSPRKTLAQSLPPDARRDYDVAKLLFEDGDYATALLKYEAAYDRTHDPRLLWDFAACQKNLRHYAKAAAMLRRYLQEGGDLLSAQDRRDAQDLDKAIAPFIVPVTLHVSEDGADVWIDDEPLGKTPLAGPVSLDIGTRRVRVKKDGFRIFEKAYPVGGSASPNIDITLEPQGGHLTLDVPPDADVAIDDHAAGHGPHLELDLPAGAHALRVAAPHMRTFQSDIVVEDGKSRTLDVRLERAAEASGEVHVAVACIGPDPLPQEKLVVFFDDSTESALPLGVRIRRELGRETIAYVPFRVTPGRHLVHVVADGCEPRDTTVDVPEGGVAEVRGMLPPSNHWLGDSPAGSPDGWRVSAGVLESTTTFAQYQNFFASGYLGSGTANGIGSIGSLPMTLVGPSASLGLHGRWLTALLDARFQLGRVTGSSTSSGQSVPFDSTLSEWTLGVRPGVRLPLVIAALSAGVGLHLGQYFFSPDAAGAGQSGLFWSVSAWAAIDAQPFCEWGLQLGTATSADNYSVSSSIGPGNSSVTTLWLHATYTPNTMCQRARAGQFGIEGTH
jgi:hypothetical protein